MDQNKEYHHVYMSRTQRTIATTGKKLIDAHNELAAAGSLPLSAVGHHRVDFTLTRDPNHVVNSDPEDDDDAPM